MYLFFRERRLHCLFISLFIFQADSREPYTSDTDTHTQDADDAEAEDDDEMDLLYHHHVQTQQQAAGADDVDDDDNESHFSNSASAASTSASVAAVSPQLQTTTEPSKKQPLSSATPSVPDPRCGLSRAPRAKRKRVPGGEVLELLAEIAANQDRSPNAEFGSFVARELDKLTERQQRRARFEIHQVLFEIQEESV